MPLPLQVPLQHCPLVAQEVPPPPHEVGVGLGVCGGFVVGGGLEVGGATEHPRFEGLPPVVQVPQHG